MFLRIDIKNPYQVLRQRQFLVTKFMSDCEYDLLLKPLL
ncbi:hypothetical protein BH09BAC6_BH09BAC6_00310 [soil metagenome]